MAELTTSEAERDMFGARKGEYEIKDPAQYKTCQSCGAAIVFIRTPKGAWAPLSLATVEWRDGRRYALVHFSDCPHADKWSKAKGKRT
jgi:hypothetical protein